MERIRAVENLRKIPAAEVTIAKLREGTEGSAALRRQVAFRAMICGFGLLWLLWIGLPAAFASDRNEPASLNSRHLTRALAADAMSRIPGRPEPQRLGPNRAPTLDDNLWSDQFGLPSCDGQLHCVIRFRGDVIVGGDFRQIGGVAANNIARWDGASWHSLGNGVEGEVSCLAVYHGVLYVGGRFQFVDGTFSRHLASWDGTAWTAIGALSGTYLCCYEVNSLTVYRDELIMAGNFGDPTYSSGFRGVARWDGSTWNRMGEGVSGTVRALLPVGDSLYVAGSFDSAGAAAAGSVAMWDGASWSPLGQGMDRTFWKSGVTSLAEFRGLLYAGGDFDSAGGEFTRGLATWDGSGWAGLPGGDVGWVFGLAVQQDTLVVANYPYIERWDGAAWDSTLPGLIGDVRMLLPDASGVIAVGDLNTYGAYPGDASAFSLAQWNGVSWVAFEPWKESMKGLATFSGGAAQVQCLATYRGDLYAGGLIDDFGTGLGWRSAQGLVAWDGSSWSSPPSWVGYGRPDALWADADTLYAGGEFYPYGFGYGAAPALRLDAGRWTPMDTLSIGARCFARYQGSLVTGMARRDSRETAPEGVYAWNGTRWAPLGITEGVDIFSGVRALTVHKGWLVAAGSFTSIGGVPADGIAAWDGITWRSLTPSGLGYYHRPWIVSVTTYDQRLLAAGQFVQGGRWVPLASLVDSVWTPVAGISGQAYSMAVVRGKLVVSGVLRLISSPEDVYVAMWDGVHWTALGSGTNGPANAILDYDNALFLGGYMSRAGGKSSFGIARWNGFFVAPPSRVPALTTGHPNPFVDGVEFSMQVHQAGRVRVTVYDARGREVVVLQEADLAAGSYPVRWDGRGRQGRRVPTGVYFVAARGPEGDTMARKVIHLR